MGLQFFSRSGFAGEDKILLITAMNRREFPALKSYIAKVDEDAFVMVSKVKEVFGKGFSY
ncbi:MAG: DUF2179 domain-containing protein [Bacillota bacterium]